MTDRKKPGFGFWTTVALVGLVAYPLSMGPAFRLLVRFDIDGDVTWDIYRQVYAPIHWVYVRGPQPIRAAVNWYCGVDP